MNKKMPDFFKNWLLRYNNDKPHPTSIIREFLEKEKTEVHAHPAYSPDLTPCNFWVFVALKWELCHRHFESDVKLVTAVNNFFQTGPPEEIHKTMLPCIANDSGYFEKDIVDCDGDVDDK